MTREEAIKTLKGEAWICCAKKWNEALDMAITALEQEPFINKPCISSEVCEHDKHEVLDKIRAEIKSISPKTYPFLNSTDNYVKEDDVLQIIDKYREEQDKG